MTKKYFYIMKGTGTYGSMQKIINVYCYLHVGYFQHNLFKIHTSLNDTDNLSRQNRCYKKNLRTATIS